MKIQLDEGQSIQDWLKAKAEAFAKKENRKVNQSDIVKAAVMIDGAEVTTSDGATVDISTIDLKTNGSAGGNADGEGDSPPQENQLSLSQIESIVRKIYEENKGKVAPPHQPAEQKALTIPATAKRTRVKNFVGKDAEYKAYAFGSYLAMNIWKSDSAKSWLEKEGLIQKAQSHISPTLGAALVPDLLAGDLIRLVEEYGVFRANSRVVPMSSDTLAFPRRTAGLTGYWTAENTVPAESNANWTTVMLTAKKRLTLTRIPSELNEDAIMSVGDLLAAEIAQDFANAEDSAGFNGDGTSTYGGIVGVLPFAGSASTSTAATANTAFSTLDLADFHAVVAKLPKYAEMNAKWYISRAGFAQSMERLAHAQGGNTITETAQGLQLSFLGYPVVITQALNSTLTAQTSTNILCFGDLSMGTLCGDRSQITVDTDSSRYFDQDQIAVRGRERIDIACHTFDSTSAAGPVIVLATPAS